MYPDVVIFLCLFSTPILTATLEQSRSLCRNNQWQCSNGDCVTLDAKCNGTLDCADGSDETETFASCHGKTKPAPERNCVVPPYPDNGRYTILSVPDASPGQSFSSLHLNVSCNPGYYVIGENVAFCVDGIWSMAPPKCVGGFCKLNKHPSVEYRCVSQEEGTRECNELEPPGTIVQPICRSPHYYNHGVLGPMTCIDGLWNHVAICTPECGRVASEGGLNNVQLQGHWRGDLPWHASIYRKTTTPFQQICEGTLISTTVVISAAHCFWTETKKLQPADDYAVAVGNLYHPWNEPRDLHAQKSDVEDIKIPLRFQGATTNFQEDIAILRLTQAFRYNSYVRPVCLDFDVNFDSTQLKSGKSGQVATWNRLGSNKLEYPALKVVELLYMDIDECLANIPPSFREYITSDKICAGHGNGTDPALCRGDGGGGLVFPDTERGIERFYLRGIMSVAPINDNSGCSTLSGFTQILKHEIFIKEHALGVI